MSKLNSRKDSSGSLYTEGDVSAKHLPQRGLDMPAKSGYRPLREDVDENPSGISLNSLRARHPKVLIKTFGCQMNKKDSEALLGLFLDKGFSLSSDVEGADIVLVNTCSVREHAENRALSFVGSLKNSSKVLGVIGCMARLRGEEVFRKMPYIDLVCGPASFDKIPEYVETIQVASHQSPAIGKRIIDLEDRLRDEDFYRASFREEKSHAYVVISTGCSNYCSYCVVPFTRGPLRLRSPQIIIEEIKKDADMGIKRITLLGQNVNDYQFRLQAASNKRQVTSDKSREETRDTKISFVDLLRMVEGIEGVEEIGFVTNNPKNTSIELFELMAKSKKIKKLLHLPFQSGSNKILKAMNRGYTKEQYLEIVKAYKNIAGGIIGTDVIVGFPGETEEDFLQTKSLLEEVRFNYAYIFMYSSRPNTIAGKLKDDVSLDEKKKRHLELLNLQKEISKEVVKLR